MFILNKQKLGNYETYFTCSCENLRLNLVCSYFLLLYINYSYNKNLERPKGLEMYSR